MSISLTFPLHLTLDAAFFSLYPSVQVNTDK